MDWKKILWPSIGKIVFLIFYAILYFLYLSPQNISVNLPDYYGFPFVYSIICGGYFSLRTNCINQFYPHLLLLDILIPIVIYLVIGFLEAESKKH